MIRGPSGRDEDRAFDLRINGDGLAPLLVASAILRVRPDLALLLVADDLEPGGNSLEPILPRRLPEAFLGLVEPSIVMEWNGFHVQRQNGVEEYLEPVWLVDPVQAWLELAGCLTPPRYCRRGDQAEVGTVPAIDLPAARIAVTGSRIVGAREIEGLALPVLADFSLGEDPARFLQYIPLGDERVAIRQLTCTDGMAPDGDLAQLLSDRWSAIAAIIAGLTAD